MEIIKGGDEVDAAGDGGRDASEEMRRRMQELEGVSGEIQGQIRELKKLKRLSLVLAAEQMESSLGEVKEEEEEEVMDERTKFFLSK